MNVVARGKCVILKKFAPKTETKGGLALPDGTKIESNFAEVVSIGCMVPPELLSVGEIVLHPGFAHVEWDDEETGEHLLLVEEGDIKGTTGRISAARCEEIIKEAASGI